jgi:hypothetical protein
MSYSTLIVYGTVDDDGLSVRNLGVRWVPPAAALRSTTATYYGRLGGETTTGTVFGVKIIIHGLV